jgi:hypothetical protein
MDPRGVQQLVEEGADHSAQEGIRKFVCGS